MYGMNEDELQQLLGFKLPEQQNFQTQNSPQLFRGLLGDTGTNSQAKLQDLILKGMNTANLSQNPQADMGGAALAEQRKAQNQQSANQEMAQQRQQQAQAGQMIGMLAKMFLPI